MARDAESYQRSSWRRPDPRIMAGDTNPDRISFNLLTSPQAWSPFANPNTRRLFGTLLEPLQRPALEFAQGDVQKIQRSLDITRQMEGSNLTATI
jgi:hypothetical protein